MGTSMVGVPVYRYFVSYFRTTCFPFPTRAVGTFMVPGDRAGQSRTEDKADRRKEPEEAKGYNK